MKKSEEGNERRVGGGRGGVGGRGREKRGRFGKGRLMMKEGKEQRMVPRDSLV